MRPSTTGLLFLAFLACSPVAIRAGEITSLAEDCSKGGKVTKILMEDCDQDEDDVCSIHHGGAARGQVHFTSSSDAQELNCKLYGDIGIGWVPFPGSPKDGCLSLLEGKCPLKSGDSIVYDINLPVESYFPSVKVTGKWVLTNEKGLEVMCFTIPIKIS